MAQLIQFTLRRGPTVQTEMSLATARIHYTISQRLSQFVRCKCLYCSVLHNRICWQKSSTAYPEYVMLMTLMPTDVAEKWVEEWWAMITRMWPLGCPVQVELVNEWQCWWVESVPIYSTPSSVFQISLGCLVRIVTLRSNCNISLSYQFNSFLENQEC